MEKRLGSGGDHGEGCPGVTIPHFLAVWRSKEVAVHLYMDPTFFYRHADSTAACYGKLLTWPISHCDCRANNYLTES